MSELIPGTEYGPLDNPNFEFAWRRGYLEAHLLSDLGKKRQNNEDACIMCAPKNPDLAVERGLLFSVADGMGGASAGEYASRMALLTLSHEYYARPFESVPVSLRAAVECANAKIHEEAESNLAYAGMGTTVSAAVVLGDWLYIAQVGDSRVYLLRERSGIHQLTDDHSLVEEQVRSGLISPEEAKNHSLKNLITRAVGIKAQVSVDLFSLRMQQGDTLLICSDGLSNMVTDSQISTTLSGADLKVATHRLIENALDGGGTDNVTAVTIRVVDAPPRTEQQGGAKEIAIQSNGFFSRLRKLFY
ncbi:MAG: Stp1/IreP family PP2C-type Ser/Thr phosphatase [Candidatus Hydrogenedentes bacterium]|nr:Stp1/IreP family PP2C-type Ser/Thr phosphatase [Candidatus Hydrogenedentota bacterium]